jgi:hypothetical protein
MPQALVLGAHDRCDVEVRVGACLRHCLLLLWGDGSIEALDMRTGVGMGIGDARAVRVEARDTLRLGVGEAQVFVAAAGPGADLLVDATAFEDGEPTVFTVPPKPTPQVSARERSDTLARRFASTLVRPSGPRRVHKRGELVVRATLGDLEQGILVGRYDRCDVQSAVADDGEVSRVHAAVILRREELYVVDLASTNGTAILEPDGGTRMELDELQRTWRLEGNERIALAGHRALTIVIDA